VNSSHREGAKGAKGREQEAKPIRERVMRRFCLFVATSVALGCGDRRPRLAEPTVTTLSNGATQVTNTGPSAWADTSGWKLVELYRVGGADAGGVGAEELVDPQSVALDAAGGIYVADRKPAVVKQFGPAGEYIRSFGREGSGPGEFQAAFIALAPGVLALHDPRSSRTSVFDSAGNFLRSWPSSCCYWFSIMVSRDTLLHVPTAVRSTGAGEPRDTYYVRYRLDGTLVDTMRIVTPHRGGEEKYWQLSGGTGKNTMMMMTGIPLAPEVTWVLDPDGGAVVAWTGDYHFVASRNGVDTAQIVSLSASPATATDERRTHLRDSMVGLYDKQIDKKAVEEAFKLSDIPSTAPYFQSIQIDERRNRWVLPDDGGNRAAARFDVFDSTGAYLGAVPVPRDFGRSWRTVWGVDRVATIAEDGDGLPVVVVYRIETRGLRTED
jgi:hypothetical protein